MPKPFVSILMLTHDAPRYVRTAVRSIVESTEDVDFELVVVDNASRGRTRRLVRNLQNSGSIQRLTMLDHNSLFAAGNNIAASLASPHATHFLLANSDIKIMDPQWLANLLEVHRRGITSYGMAESPLRVEGYCLLIDADLYRGHLLDESHEWWWGVTKLQAALLREGFSVQGFREHERFVHHFGGKSGDAFAGARGMDVTREEVDGWFAGHVPTDLDPR